VGAHHAEDVRTGEFPDVLDELLEPVPCPLRLFYRRQSRRARLVFRELGADQVKNRSHSFPKLDAVSLSGVSVLDQLVKMFLSIHLEHYEPNMRSEKER